MDDNEIIVFFLVLFFDDVIVGDVFVSVMCYFDIYEVVVLVIVGLFDFFVVGFLYKYVFEKVICCGFFYIWVVNLVIVNDYDWFFLIINVDLIDKWVKRVCVFFNGFVVVWNDEYYRFFMFWK